MPLAGRAQNDNQQWQLGLYQTLHQPGGKRLCAEETAQADKQKKDRYDQQAIDLAFAELGIGWHGTRSINETYLGRGCSRSRSAAPGRVP